MAIVLVACVGLRSRCWSALRSVLRSGSEARGCHRRDCRSRALPSRIRIPHAASRSRKFYSSIYHGRAVDRLHLASFR